MGKRANELKKRKRQHGASIAAQPSSTKPKTAHINGNGNGKAADNGDDGDGEGDYDAEADAEFDIDVETAVTVLQDLVEHSEKLLDKRLKVLKGAVWGLHRVMTEKAGVGTFTPAAAFTLEPGESVARRKLNLRIITLVQDIRSIIRLPLHRCPHLPIRDVHSAHPAQAGCNPALGPRMRCDVRGRWDAGR